MRSKILCTFLLLCCAFPYVIIHSLENQPSNFPPLNGSEKELVYWLKVGYTFILFVGLITILSRYTNPLTDEEYESS